MLGGLKQHPVLLIANLRRYFLEKKNISQVNKYHIIYNKILSLYFPLPGLAQTYLFKWQSCGVCMKWHIAQLVRGLCYKGAHSNNPNITDFTLLLHLLCPKLFDILSSH